MGTAVVTGSSTGIGFAIALKLAQEGERVLAGVRSKESGAALEAAATGLDLELLLMDVDDDASVAGALGGVGPIDILVNNAGISEGYSVEETPIAQFQAVMNTNTWGSLRCIQAVLPGMRERGTGTIVNVTSVSGRVPMAQMGAYTVSKQAQEALTEVLAMETAGFGIRVAAIEPGVILTPIFEKALSRPALTDSPYQSQSSRLVHFFVTALGAPTMPDAVADAVWHAITTDDPELRYTVGPDADRLATAYASTGSDEWIARAGDLDDEAWKKFFGEASGVPL